MAAFVMSVPGVLLLFAAALAQADDWGGPAIAEVFSASREYFVRVIPGESLGDTFGFAGAKKGRYAAAEFYRRGEDRSYRLTAEVALLNPIAPVEFFVSDDGQVATVDNWHNVGYGKVVSIYDSAGKVIRAYELAELFQPEEIKRFRHSMSSIHWRSGPLYIRQDQKTLLITVKAGTDLLFGLESGRYQYCEPAAKTYRCRNASEPREWISNAKAQVTR
jgi:hypothetical protein